MSGYDVDRNEFDVCIACGKWIADLPEPFCNESCRLSWNLEQMRIENELEEEQARRMEDPNAGCWSYSW